MANRKLLSIVNKFDKELIVELEPVPEIYSLEPAGKIDIVSSDQGGTVSINFGQLEGGQVYIAVWPEIGRATLERDGNNVFGDT